MKDLLTQSGYALSLRTLDDLELLFVGRAEEGRYFLTRDRDKAYKASFLQVAAIARDLNDKGVAGLWQPSMSLPPPQE